MKSTAGNAVCSIIKKVSWQVLEPVFSFDKSRVLIFVADVNDFSEQKYEQFFKALSVEEVFKAKSFVHAIHRNQYVLAHYFLRFIIGKITGLPIGSINFNFTANKKPVLDYRKELISFNLSHSGNKVLLGIYFNGEIGVDIEKIEPGFDYQTFADAHFSDGEKFMSGMALNNLIVDDFFITWTRKEAWLKLTGEGLTEDLKALDTSVSNDKLAPTVFIDSVFIDDYAISIAVHKKNEHQFFLLK